MIVCVFSVFVMSLCQFGIILLCHHVSLHAINRVLSCMHTHVVSSLMHYIRLVTGGWKVRITFLNCHALGTMVMSVDKS